MNMFQCFLGFHPNMISASEKLPPISESPCQHSENRPCGTAPCSSFRPAPLSESCICGTAPCSSFPPAHHSETWPCGTGPCSSFSIQFPYLKAGSVEQLPAAGSLYLTSLKGGPGGSARCISFPQISLSESWLLRGSSLQELLTANPIWKK